MNRLIKNIVLLAITGLVTTGASAITLSLSPDVISTTSGGTFFVDLVVSDLGDGTAPSLGDFDLDILFDPADLAFSGYSLGVDLGAVSFGESLDVSFGEYLPGVVNLAQVSLLAAGFLDGSQTDTFTLATLEFVEIGLDQGQSTVIDFLGVYSFGDSGGLPIVVDALSPASITETPVPVPAALWLLLSALYLVVPHRVR